MLVLTKASLEVQNNVKLIREQGLMQLDTLINVGSDYFVQARVPDTSTVFLEVGLGFHAEFKLSEVDAFITDKSALLQG